MKQSRTQYITTIGSVLFLVVLGGVFVQAQTHEWVSLNNRTAKWKMNGTHTYTTNVGSTVVGEIHPDGGLYMDINGDAGATAYCDSADDFCFEVEDVRWRASSQDMYLPAGTNLAIGATTTSYALGVDGDMRAGAYYYTSDENLKTNIHPVEGMDIISQLEGVRFNWKESGTESIGLIAQDVEQVLPELVSTDPDTGMKAVQYADVVAVLTQALKEQDVQLEELRSEIEQELSQ